MGEFIDFGRADIECLAEWWREAGVDTMIDEAPRIWLEIPAKADMARGIPISDTRDKPKAVPSIEIPTTIAAFIDWLMSDPAVPVGGPVSRRIRPAGSPGAGLMILTDLPEARDVDSRALLTGDAGALLDRMLGALGENRTNVYIATVAPGRTLTGRLSEREVEQLAAIARAHVRLAAPKRLWLVGRAASRAILGMDEASAAGRLHEVNLDGVTVNAIATVHPNILLDEERNGGRTLRRAAWKEMQRLIEDQGA